MTVGEQMAHAGRMFVTAVAGLAPVVALALARLPGVDVTGSGFDGRADVVLFSARCSSDDLAALAGLGLTEDVFVEVGRTLRADGDRPGWIASRIWRPERVSRALSVYAGTVAPLRAAASFRVVARVRQERSFLRTDLRRHLTEVIARDRPRWRLADPAQLEIWVTEYSDGQFVAGLRLSGAQMRQHGGREAQRPGALRPTVARAMVCLAGEPDGVLLDPCCGSGTILAEARDAGWQARGVDIDADAVAISRKNVAGVPVDMGDVRGLDIADSSIGACAANLPFGRQYHVPGDPDEWLAAALRELARVTRPGGRLVLLAPRLPRAVLPPSVRMIERHRIHLLGVKTTIWVLGH